MRRSTNGIANASATTSDKDKNETRQKRDKTTRCYDKKHNETAIDETQTRRRHETQKRDGGNEKHNETPNETEETRRHDIY